MQLRVTEFQQRLSEFESRGIRVVAISVDPPEIIVASGKNWVSPTRSFPIPRRKSFVVTICCMPAQDRKAPILPALRSFLLIPPGQFAG
jgi:hypothetical protein